MNKTELPNSHNNDGKVLINSALAGRPYSSQPNETQPDLVCFSHLRWDFVYQRPQHLLSRCGRERRVFFVEEPIFGNGSMRLDIEERPGGVQVVVPRLPEGLRSEVATSAVMKEMIRRLFEENGI